MKSKVESVREWVIQRSERVLEWGDRFGEECKRMGERVG